MPDCSPEVRAAAPVEVRVVAPVEVMARTARRAALTVLRVDPVAGRAVAMAAMDRAVVRRAAMVRMALAEGQVDRAAVRRVPAADPVARIRTTGPGQPVASGISGQRLTLTVRLAQSGPLRTIQPISRQIRRSLTLKNRPLQRLRRFRWSFLPTLRSS